MPKFKIALNTSAGELDSRVVEVSETDYEDAGEGAAVTAEVIKWLEDGLLLADGDSLTITELDNA